MFIRLGDVDDIYHGKTEDVHFTANYTGEQIVESYRKAAVELQADFENDICCEADDNFIREDIVDKLTQAGIDFTGLLDNFMINENKDLVEIILQMARLNLKDLTWEFGVEKPILQRIGHGLFYPTWMG